MPARQQLKDGENMEHLSLVRHDLEKELGPENLKRIRATNIVLDILLMTIPPLISWTTTVLMWNHSVSSPVYWIAAFVSGWSIMTCALCWHDVVGHRGAFGRWTSWIVGLWVTTAAPGLITGINTTWLARHRIHHKHTFEEKDPELFRNKLDGRMQRLLSLFGVYRAVWRKRIYRQYNQEMDVEKEYPGSLGKEYAFKIAVERKLCVLHNLILISLLLFRPAATLRTVIGAIGFYGIFDTLRYILEHGEQDLDNPYWQSTLYKTGWATQLACTWCGGDCHSVHHIWSDVPIYRMREAVKLVTPLLQRKGVTVRTDFWALVRAYLFEDAAHATKWFDNNATKVRSG